ncbi:MAG: phosphatidylglycerophosphatase A [Chloracidobacterium sp.]|nr:phosphatidylglycerophosphatase A [Chloracidobacterium sp.]
MKQTVEKRNPNGVIDYIALALTTFGVGLIPGAPGTYGSIVAVAIYLIIGWVEAPAAASGAGAGLSLSLVFFLISTFHLVINGVALVAFSLAGIWASGRSIPLLGNDDPSEAVVDEVMGQLITFCFIPFGLGWPFILAGFLLFRLFDIWKPYPINNLQNLSGGLGVCADDIVAGVYAGICLAIGYAIYLAV